MFWNVLWGAIILALVVSGLFNAITWEVNIPLIIAVLLAWAVSLYNNLVRFRNRAKEALSDIDVQTKRRYDLIPNLMESVKGYMTHEREVFEKVTEARANAISAGGAQKAGAENVLSGALKSLFAVAENYPELKANQNFLALQEELTDTEDKIQAARRFYNTNVRDMNTAIETFPTNIFAQMFGFAAMEFFETESAAEREPVKVKF